jgi:6-phosphogluconolactonase
MSGPEVIVTPDESHLVSALAQAVAEVLASPGRHDLVVTGGGVGTEVLAALVQPAPAIDWSMVHIWWGDERFLPEGHVDRNETGARAALLDHVPIPASNVHPMPADRGQGVTEAARSYADELARHSTQGFVPDFDVLLLGMGPEGHVASLFPGMPALHASTSTVAITDSPKPPPVRVSLTLAAIRSARQVWIGAAGSSKADAAARAADPQTNVVDCPAVGARGRDATLLWLDAAAAAAL